MLSGVGDTESTEIRLRVRSQSLRSLNLRVEPSDPSRKMNVDACRKRTFIIWLAVITLGGLFYSLSYKLRGQNGPRDALVRMCAVIVVVKDDGHGNHQVRTQTRPLANMLLMLFSLSFPLYISMKIGLCAVFRHVLNKAYDPLYDGTIEALGESILEGEKITNVRPYNTPNP